MNKYNEVAQKYQEYLQENNFFVKKSMIRRLISRIKKCISK